MRRTECTPRARILALGGYRPTGAVSNHGLVPMVNADDEWIRGRAGIASRGAGAPAETLADMAAAAGAKALAACGLAPADIDLVIVATSTAETATPNVSAAVAGRLCMSAPAAFDINHACAGFSYALEAASGAVRAGTSRHALVIGAEKYSQGSDWTDRPADRIFADGAGAAVVGAAAGGPAPAIGPVIWASDATAVGETHAGEGGSCSPQGGQAVSGRVSTLPSAVRRACAATGIAPAELAAIAAHHADLRTIKSIGAAIGAPQARVATDFVRAGNASVPSIPLALTAMTDHGAIPSGAPVLLLEFGAQLCYAAQVIRTP
jgi:3-oxoacyl-[acyl-carrier-protein] synthase III